MNSKKWISGGLGSLGIVLIWWVVAATSFRNTPKGSTESIGAIPTPPEVLAQFGEDGFEFFARNAMVTITEAGIGFLWGNLAAIALAAVALTLPKLENLASQIALITYCIPIVAIGPIIRLVLGAPKAGEPSETAIALAALSVFFTTMVGAMTGVKSADKAALDVVTVFGGNAWHRLVKVQLLTALPSIFAALRIAAPAAFLGASMLEALMWDLGRRWLTPSSHSK
jgi:ABC-type nitrate/sulfonate/bicarbonate transport system permease component